MKLRFTICLLTLLSINKTSAQQFKSVLTGSIVTTNRSSSGCSWADYNKDGYPDLYVCNFNASNQLFKNNGDGTFQEITVGDIVSDSGVSNAAVWGDYDNDGNLDIYVSNNPSNTSPPQANFLYKNNGTPTYDFTKITIAAAQNNQNYTWSSSWVDYDNDGDLDLHVPDNKHLRKDFFYENNGDATFTSIFPAFVTPNVESTGVVAWMDYDHDGDQDLFMIKSGRSHPQGREDNRMYHNTLSESDEVDFQRVLTAGMVNHFDLDFQASWGDYDNDGDMDVYLGNFDNRNYLYRNEGDSLFTKITTGPHVIDNHRTLGSTFGDFDNDGDLDLYVLNTNGQGNKYYQNDGSGNFTSLNSTQVGTPLSNITATNSVAHSDYNNDGYLDLYVANTFTGGNARNNLYLNNGGDQHFLELTLNGVESNNSAFGTKIWVKANIDGSPRWQLRHLTGNPTGNHSQDDLRIHFGLGDAQIVDSLVIVWPLGLTEIYTNIEANQFLDYTEGATTSISEVQKSVFNITVFPNPATYETSISFEIHESNQPLQLKVVSADQKEVETIFDGMAQKGTHEYILDVVDFAAGIYYLILKNGKTVSTHQMMVVK